jgi:selenocysteine lyase/cysteine desulfurase
MLSRKDFIYRSTMSIVPLTVAPAIVRCTENKVDEQDDIWITIRKQFVIANEVINLNNGAVSPQPIPVQQAHAANLQLANTGPSFFMWRKLDQQREPLRKRLATLFGCDAEELAINRNTTEGLNTIIAGLPLQKGDEVILSKYDYPNMLNAWKQRAQRDGIVLKWVELKLPEENAEEITAKYKEALSPATKVVHITHVINWTGQIMPVKQIADLARANGAAVMLDAAHSFAQFDFKLSDFAVDYAATSLHKWLCAPFGTGMLYIRKENISKVWPAFATPEYLANNIRKFESIGTRSFAAEMAINNAIDFHEKIGIQQKEERLRFLKNYWCDQVKHLPKVRFYTSMKNEFSCGMATFTILGFDASTIDTRFMSDFKIHTSVVKVEQLNGIRISPHVYTSLSELDVLVKAIKTLSL